MDTETGATLEQDVPQPESNDLPSTGQAFEDYFNDGSDNGQEPEDTEGDGESLPQGVDAEEEKFIAKVNGKEVEVTKAELLETYQKERAADKKFEEAASIRKEAQQSREKFDTEANKLQNALNHFAQVAQQWDSAGLLSPPDKSLLDSDPVRYLKEDREYNERIAEIQKAHASQQYLQQQMAEQREIEMQSHIEAERGRLTVLIPEWKDAKVAEKEQAELVTYLRKQGYDDADLNELSNSRASNVALVVKAMRYDQGKQNIVAGKAKPQPVRTIGSQPSSQFSQDAYSAAKKKAFKTGSATDAADAFSQMFGN